MINLWNELEKKELEVGVPTGPWYQKWRDTYMVKTDKGWERNNDMWEQNENGEWIMKPVQK